MMQFYFLSVLANVIAGLALLFSETEDEKYKFFQFVKNPHFKLVLGIVEGVISLVTLVSGGFGGQWVILGDLIPSLTGALASFTLLYSFYLEKQTVESTEKDNKMRDFFINNQKYFGITCLVVAFLHFLFPKVIIL